jgi:hypothetical protein
MQQLKCHYQLLILYTISVLLIDIQAHGVIEMPNPPPNLLIFEPFIETDEIIFSSKSTNENGHRLVWKGCSRWVEVTVGVIGKRGFMRSLSPSVTVKETGDILSLEEKFQGMSLPVVIHYCTN